MAYGKTKLKDMPTICYFLGYAFSQRGYIFLYMSTHMTYTNRHVVYFESEFPF